VIDLFRPPQIVPSKVFVLLVSNPALFLASCCSFLLHVVTIFDAYLLSYSSAGSTFNSSKIYLFPLWSKTYPDGKLNGFEMDIQAGHHIVIPLNTTYDNASNQRFESHTRHSEPCFVVSDGDIEVGRFLSDSNQ
jgi:hypothetical protein